MLSRSYGIMLITLPIPLPMWKAVGLDLVWMGILVVMLLEIGLLTPPVGLNAFVVNTVVGGRVSLTTIFRGLIGLSSSICSSSCCWWHSQGLALTCHVS